MPVRVDFFRDEKGRTPVRDWLEELRRHDAKAWKMCKLRFEQLAEKGHTLDRPYAAHLQDKVYELRAWSQHAHHRLLYSFDGQGAAVVTHAVEKNTDRVPDRDIEEAKRRMSLYLADRERHSAERAAEPGRRRESQQGRNRDFEKGKEHGKGKEPERDD